MVAFTCVLFAASLYTRRYVRSVADFLVANRCAGRYLLAVAGNMAGLGAISILAWYEMFYEGGFGADCRDLAVSDCRVRAGGRDGRHHRPAVSAVRDYDRDLSGDFLHQRAHAESGFMRTAAAAAVRAEEKLAAAIFQLV